MSLTRDIFASYRAPRAVLERQIARGITEPQVLMFMVLACGLILVAQMPVLSRQATLDPTVTFEQRMGGALFGVMFLLPLILYGIAGLIQLGLKLARRDVPGIWVRLALFWALLVVTPLMLLQGGISALAGPGAMTQLLGFVVAGAFLYILGANLATAMRAAQRSEPASTQRR